MKYKRTIFFTDKDNTDRYCIIDEELNSKFFRPRFEIKEYVFGIKTNAFNRFGIMDENREIIELSEYKRRKLECGYFEVPNDDYGYDNLFGVFKKNGDDIGIRKYLELTNEFVPINIPNSAFSRKIYEYMINNQSLLKEKMIDKLYLDYLNVKEAIKDSGDEEYLDTYPKINQKNELLKMVDFRSMGIASEENYNHNMSDKTKIWITGECFWDEEHGFEIYFGENYEIQDL